MIVVGAVLLMSLAVMTIDSILDARERGRPVPWNRAKLEPRDVIVSLQQRKDVDR